MAAIRPPSDAELAHLRRLEATKQQQEVTA
jgi:hypothetical protein